MFSFTLTTRTIRYTVILAVFFCVSVLAGLIPAAAHENHAPLPTKGVTIAGNNILLSDKARKAIGLTTEKVTLGDLHRTVEVNARVELPWNQQAMITSLVPGKIEKVLAGPGEKVAAGQELAQLVSSQLESLQLALLQASNQVALAQRVAQQQRALNAQGVIAGKSLMEAESELAQRKAQLRIAREKLLSLGIDDKDIDSVLATGKPLAYLSIRSPIAGVITNADVRIGQVVKTTDHLYHVANSAGVWVVGEVVEPHVPR